MAKKLKLVELDMEGNQVVPKPGPPPILTEAQYRCIVKDKKWLRTKDAKARLLLLGCSEEFLQHLFDFAFQKRNKADEFVLISAEMVSRERQQKYDGTGFPTTLRWVEIEEEVQ